MDHLNDDMLIEIFNWMTHRELITIRCVCVRWRDLIAAREWAAICDFYIDLRLIDLYFRAACPKRCFLGINGLDKHLAHLRGRKLDYLSLACCERITDNGLKQVGGVTNLHIHGARAISDAGLMHLSMCRILDASYTSITSDAFKYMPLLEKINVRSCKITDEAMLYMSKCVDLNIGCCELITGAHIDKLISCKTFSAEFCNIGQNLEFIGNFESICLKSNRKLNDKMMDYYKNCVVVDIRDCLITHHGIIKLKECKELKVGNDYMREGDIVQCIRTFHYETFHTLSKLEKITVEGARYTDDTLAAFKNYKSVRLIISLNTTDDGIKYLEDVDNVNLEFLNVTSSSVSLLKSRRLRIYCCDSVIFNVKFNCKNLEIMDSNITDDNLVHFQDLETITLIDCKNITLAGILNLSNKTTVVIFRCPNIKCKDIADLDNVIGHFLDDCECEKKQYFVW
jgi:hypothetical protein